MSVQATEEQSIWEERVRAWQASGGSARKYAESNGFSESTLRHWAYRLVGTSKALRILRLVPNRCVRVVSRTSRPTSSQIDIRALVTQGDQATAAATDQRVVHVEAKLAEVTEELKVAQERNAQLRSSYRRALE